MISYTHGNVGVRGEREGDRKVDLKRLHAGGIDAMISYTDGDGM